MKLGYDLGRQIVCDQRQKTLMCFLNHLEPAPLCDWSQMHAEGDIKKGKKRYSKIQLKAQDYSQGTGEKSTYCLYNFDPADIRNLKNVADHYTLPYMAQYPYERKLFKVMSQTGLADFYAITISRNPQMRIPWGIEVQNGQAFDSKPKNETVKKVSQRFTDEQFYDLITKVYTFLTLWEQTFVTKIIETGQKLTKAEIDRYNESKNNGGLNGQ